MALSAAILQTLHSIVGDKGFVTTPSDIAPYLVESRGRYQGHCDVLIKPANTHEVSDVLSLCNDHNIAVVPQGGNSGHCGGAVPSGGILLNLSRLSSIRNLDPMNATISVDAGCILENVQKAAQDAGFLFPLSLAAEGTCQIGGNLSTNAGGVHVLRYGNMRDLTLGLEVVLADGRIWDGMRSLRKDNTGYDLKHMFMGAEGTLGVITGAVLKLYPRPKETATFMVASQSPAHLMDVFSVMRSHFGEEVNSFEIVPRFGIELTTRHFSDLHDPFDTPHAWYGLIEIATTQDDRNLVQTIESHLEKLLECDDIQDAVIAQNLEQAQTLWALRENMSEAQKREGASIKHDISVPVSKIPDFLAETSHAIQNILPGARLCTFGHAGDGNVHFNISQPLNMDSDIFKGHTKDLNEIVHDMADKYDGSFSAEHGIGLLKTPEMSLYCSDVELDLMRSLKQTLDPNAILNPGKVVPDLE